ncbi:MAG: glycosyltransferase [Methanosarcinales archaeon]
MIIPTYNEEKFIERTLKKLTNQTIPRNSYEVIVVDGNSNDRTREIAKKYADKVIIQKSKGVAGARNDGIRIAKYDFVATTDADVIVPKDWLENILYHLNNGSIAVCGPDEPIEKTRKSKITFFFLRYLIRISSLFKYYCLGGTNSAFKKDVFQKIGGYRILPHSDDADLSFRFRKLGKITYDKRLNVKVSTRRMEKHGYLKTLWTWFKGDMRLLLGKKLKDIKYIREDYN